MLFKLLNRTRGTQSMSSFCLVHQSGLISYAIK